MSSQRCSREETQGWQSNDSSLLAGTFHHAYLINDSTSPYCPEGELLATKQLFILVLRSRPFCGHRQCCDYEELSRDIKYELEEQSSWRDSCQKAEICNACSGFLSPVDQGGAEGDDSVDLARKMFLHRKKHEPEICASGCSFVSWTGEVLFFRHYCFKVQFPFLLLQQNVCQEALAPGLRLWAYFRAQSEQFGTQM